MSVGVRENPFFALGSALLGIDPNEGQRFRNLAYAENARADADFARARTDRVQQGTNAQAKIAAAMQAGGGALGLGDLVNLAPLLNYIPNDSIEGPRAAFGLAAARNPNDQARVVGGVGGDARNTVYAVDQGNQTSRANAATQAGATVRAAEIAQNGATQRHLLTPLNPGADGVYLTPEQRRRFGLPPDPGTGPLAPGVQGVPVPPSFGDMVFLPGAANVSPGATRVSPVPGLQNPNAPTMSSTTAPAQDRSTVPGVVGDLARRGIAGTLTPTEQENLRVAGVGLGDLLLPGVARQNAANAGSARVAAIAADAQRYRADTSALIADMNNVRALDVTRIAGASRERVEALRVEARDIAAQAGLASQERRAELALRAAEIRAETAQIVQGMQSETQLTVGDRRNETQAAIAAGNNQTQASIAAGNNQTQAAIAAGNNQTQRDVAELRGRAAVEAARLRADNQRPRQPNATVTNGITDGITSFESMSGGSSLTERAKLLVRELASNFAMNGMDPAVAVSRAVQELQQDGSLASRGREAMGMSIPGTGILDLTPEAEALVAARRANPRAGTGAGNPPAVPRLGDAVTGAPAPGHVGGGAPPAAAGAAPAASGWRAPDGRVIPEGTPIRQNGQTFIIRNGQPVPGA